MQLTHQGNNMAAETAAGGYVAFKLGGAIIGVALIASVIGFVVLWPKTLKEGVSRIAATILGSIVLGPAAVIAAFQRFPSIFEAGANLAIRIGVDPLYGWIAAGAPWMVLAGLPVWWIGGAMARWFENRHDKDIGEMATDARDAVIDMFPKSKRKGK